MANATQRSVDVEVRVRYCETDPMGFLHHSLYFVYFEMGRTELLRVQGGDYRAMEEQGQYLVVAEADCRFRSPARYDDVLIVRTDLTSLSFARMEHQYEVFRGEELLTTGRTVLACVNREGKILKLSSVLPNYRILVDHMNLN